MIYGTVPVLIFILVMVIKSSTSSSSSNERNDLDVKARSFVDRYNEEISRLLVHRNKARWYFNTNMTSHREQEVNFMELHLSNRSSVLLDEARLLFTNVTAIKNDTIRRQMKLILISSTSRDLNVRERLNEVKSQMMNIYSQAHVEYDARFIKTFDASMPILKVIFCYFFHASCSCTFLVAPF